MKLFRASMVAIAGCLGAFFFAVSPSRGSTLIDYHVVTSSTSWSGQFEVANVGDPAATTLPIKISGPTTSSGPPQGSFNVGNYFPTGSDAANWYTVDPETIVGYFSVSAPSFVSGIESASTWSQLMGAYPMSAAGFQANAGSTDWTTAAAGTFYFGVALPEPSTYAMALAGVACGGYSMWRRRKRA